MVRRPLLVILVLAAAACGSPRYSVSTCSFAGHAGDCAPISVGDEHSGSFQYHFSLIDPRAMQPTCSGELTLELARGQLHYHARELDPAVCVEVGDEMEGTSAIAGKTVVDVYYPRQDFTFRVQVEE